MASLNALIQIVETPRKCSYLPAQKAALELCLCPDVSPAEYSELLARGYRRFGWQVFRPACRTCRECRSVRVLVPEYVFDAGDRRVMRQNQEVRRELSRVQATHEHVALINRYQRFMHQHRGWALQQHDLTSYHESFCAGSQEVGWQWNYYRHDHLLGVALMDQVREAISLVYFFHHPDWRPRSPGRFSILNQLQYAKQQGLRYAYLGYWIKDCPSMTYKKHFRPCEILLDPVAEDADPIWSRAESSFDGTGYTLSAKAR